MNRVVYSLVLLLVCSAATASWAGFQSGSPLYPDSKSENAPFPKGWGAVDEGDDSQDLAPCLGAAPSLRSLPASAKQACHSARLNFDKVTNYYCRAPPLNVPVRTCS